jgi:hypothetical protein
MRCQAPALLCAVALAASLAASSRPPAQAGPLRFSLTLPHRAGGAPIDGRLLVIVSRVEGTEPRFQVGDGPSGQPVFGVDVEGWTPGRAATVDGSVVGFPLDCITDIPAGTYTVQALLHKYETFRRGDGHTVKMPMDRGDGQQWARAPGNLYSTPARLTIGPKAGTIAIALDRTIPPIPPPKDTKYIRHERIQSQVLTKFWGRPMHLGANAVAGVIVNLTLGADHPTIEELSMTPTRIH